MIIIDEYGIEFDGNFMLSTKISKSDLPVLYVALKQFKGVIK